MIKAGIYARYSTDMQNETSTDDQIMMGSEYIAREKWKLAETYADPEVSGSSMFMRPELQRLLRDAASGKIDVVVSEALDRISRDQADIATIWKRLQFLGVDIYTLAEGKISELHIGLKGTMNAITLKDLAQKTRRGLRGRVERGKSGGGISYGYDVVKQFNADGEPIRGDRVINEDEAMIVRRIFKEYAGGRSPKAIAQHLNKQGIPGPRNGEWAASTINGNRKRGTGILNNDLYVGMLVWNRQRFLKNPDTGKRVPRFNADEEWTRKEVPELRIVDQELWDSVRARQKVIERVSDKYYQKQRPRKLFSYLLKCGCCGGGLSMVAEARYGCSAARNKGTCSSRVTVRQEVVEKAVLDALQNHLMDPSLCQVFCDEYLRHINEMRMERNAVRRSHQSELERLGREKDKLIQSIKDGVPGSLIKDDLIRVGQRQEELKGILETTEDSPVLIHPRMADRYKAEVIALRQALNDEAHTAEAADLLRSLIDKIVVTPRAGRKRFSIDLYGDLAGILSIAANRSKAEVQSELDLLGQHQIAIGDAAPDHFHSLKGKMVAGACSHLDLAPDNNPQVKMVAGAGFEPATFGL